MTDILPNAILALRRACEQAGMRPPVAIVFDIDDQLRLHAALPPTHYYAREPFKPSIMGVELRTERQPDPSC